MPDHASNSQDGDLAALAEAAEGYQQIRAQIGKTIVGQEAIIRPLLASVFAEGHVLLIGVPGLAKTLLVKSLAQTLHWSFRRIQFTPDMMPADITGMEVLLDQAVGAGQAMGSANTGAARRMQFVPGPIFANIVLADEINRSPPKTQAALLEAMAEYHVTSMGQQHDLDRPFIVVATQNPIEQEGTYPLPEAQLDRFLFSLWMEYPSEQEEQQIVAATTGELANDIEAVFTREQILAFQRLVRRVPASAHVVEYAVALTRATRPQRRDAVLDWKSDGLTAASSGRGGGQGSKRHGLDGFVDRYIQWGAGPRAAQAMVLAGKALAILDGQPTVTAAHIREAAPWVLRHRVVPNFAATGEGITAATLVEGILREVPEPAHR